MAKAITITNEKGGVGKTTVSTNLTYEISKLTSKKEKNLLIDLDPQGHATKAYRAGDNINITAESLSLFNDEHVEPMQIKDNLYLIGSNRRLGQAARMNNEVMFTFADQCEQYKQEGFNIFFDTNPFQPFLTSSGMLASEYVLLITEAESYSVDSMAETIRTMNTIKKMKKDLSVMGYVINKVDFRESLHSEIVEQLRNTFASTDGPFVCALPRRAAVYQAAEQFKLLSEYSPKSDIVELYQQLAEKVIANLKTNYAMEAIA